jgi:pimeloyl-ACP methyl ester carboxylesterase
MRWAGFTDVPGKTHGHLMLDLMYLGLKHFRMPPGTSRIAANPMSDDELRALPVPVLFLMGENEVLYDAATALARARRLIPDFEGELLPGCRHDMCVSHRRIVDARVLGFLRRTRPQPENRSPEHVVA